MLEAIARKKLSKEVLGTLRRYILSRGLQPGDRLPTERDLASDLGVSRGTVREALKTLEAIGAISRHPRRGSVLCPVDFGSLAEVSQFLMVRSAEDFQELFEARRVLEMSILPLAAAHATEEDYARMDAANQLMDAEIAANGVALEGDIAFHRALLLAAHNKFLGQFGDLIQEFFRDGRTRLHVDADAARGSVAVHRRMVEGLRAGDVAGAQQLMAEHLMTYVQRLVVPNAPVEPVGDASTVAE